MLAFSPGYPALVKPALSSIRTDFYYYTLAPRQQETPPTRVPCHCVQQLLWKRLTTTFHWGCRLIGCQLTPSMVSFSTRKLGPFPLPLPSQFHCSSACLQAFLQTACGPALRGEPLGLLGLCCPGALAGAPGAAQSLQGKGQRTDSVDAPGRYEAECLVPTSCTQVDTHQI